MKLLSLIIVLFAGACDTSPTDMNPGEPWLRDSNQEATTWDGGTACWIVQGIVACPPGDLKPHDFAWPPGVHDSGQDANINRD
jgi:hypothetical protein